MQVIVRHGHFLEHGGGDAGWWWVVHLHDSSACYNGERFIHPDLALLANSTQRRLPQYAG